MRSYLKHRVTDRFEGREKTIIELRDSNAHRERRARYWYSHSVQQYMTLLTESDHKPMTILAESYHKSIIGRTLYIQVAIARAMGSNMITSMISI